MWQKKAATLSSQPEGSILSSKAPAECRLSGDQAARPFPRLSLYPHNISLVGTQRSEVSIRPALSESSYNLFFCPYLFLVSQSTFLWR